MAEEIKSNVVRIIVKDVYSKEGVLQNFKEYQIVRQDQGGRLQRCKFKRDVNVAYFDGMKKFEAEFEYKQEAKNYEYPIMWLGSLKADTIKKLL